MHINVAMMRHIFTCKCKRHVQICVHIHICIEKDQVNTYTKTINPMY